MRYRCCEIIESMGRNWMDLGWALALLWAVAPALVFLATNEARGFDDFFIASAPVDGQLGVIGIRALLGALWVTWWVMDAADQDVPAIGFPIVGMMYLLFAFFSTSILYPLLFHWLWCAQRDDDTSP